MAEPEVHDDDVLFACTNDDEYHLIILPTEKCNFHCSYCYEKHDVGRMSPTVVNSIKLLLSRNMGGISHLSIDWFGGEPLLGVPVIKDINGFAQNFIQSTGSKVDFRSAITTNAYLLSQPLFKELLTLGVCEYQISLDGPKSIHDSTRVKLDGSGTFDRIWSNLVQMSDTEGQFRVLLRVHVTQDNIDKVPELLDTIKTTFGRDSRFKIFLKAIQNLGGYGSEYAASKGLPENDVKLGAIEQELRGPNEFWHPNSICHASKFNSFIIRADGKISKCTTALYDDVNMIGTLEPDGRMNLDREKVLRWSRGLFTMDRDVLYCPYGGIHKDCSSCDSTTVADKHHAFA
jgi:uncharacterized protein